MHIFAVSWLFSLEDKLSFSLIALVTKLPSRHRSCKISPFLIFNLLLFIKEKFSVIVILRWVVQMLGFSSNKRKINIAHNIHEHCQGYIRILFYNIGWINLTINYWNYIEHVPIKHLILLKCRSNVSLKGSKTKRKTEKITNVVNYLDDIFQKFKRHASKTFVCCHIIYYFVYRKVA